MYTLLIVDDVQTDRELIGMVVSREGHRVAYAADGNEAIHKAKELKPRSRKPLEDLFFEGGWGKGVEVKS